MPNFAMGTEALDRQKRLQVEFIEKLLSAFPDGECTTSEVMKKLGIQKAFVQKKMQNLQLAGLVIRESEKWKIKLR